MDVLLGKPIPRWQPWVGGFASIALSLLAMLAPQGSPDLGHRGPN